MVVLLIHGLTDQINMFSVDDCSYPVNSKAMDLQLVQFFCCLKS